jgi:hypothetical protein
MEIEDSETYRSILEAEICRQTDHAFELLIVNDVAEWAAERSGSIKNNPPASAVVDGETGTWGILLRRTIDDNWVNSILDRIEFGGFCRTKEVLNTPEIFLRHLVLHEVAHLTNDWCQENENDCDAWAFMKLGIEAI